MPVEQLPFILLGENEQMRRCVEPSDYIKKIEKPKPVTGFYVSDVEKMILQLRKEGYSANRKEIEKEAIRRCRFMVG